MKLKCGSKGDKCPQAFPFTVGTDPEFGLVDGTSADGYISESRLWSREREEICGIDGAGTVFELRPSPAYCAHVLVDNIAKAFWAQKEFWKSKRKKLVAAPMCGGHAAGGHLHFGVSHRDSTTFGRIIRNLDRILVGEMYKVYPREEWDRRARGNYGKLSDFREQPWGFEYRTLPTFMAERGLCVSVISLAGSIVEETINHHRIDSAGNLDDCKKLPSFIRRWREISYINFLQRMGWHVRTDNNLKHIWKI